MTILIVEQGEEARAALRRRWDETEVEGADEPAAARDLFDGERHRMALVDLDLPGSVDFVAWLKAEAAVPVALFGTHADQSLLRRVGETGADGFLLKPLDPVAVVACVETLLFVGRGDLGPVAGGASERGLTRRQIEQVEAHVDRGLEDQMVLGDLASLLDMSPSHFSRSFKLATGVTPHAFVTGRRLDRAEQLLAQTELPVAEVASAVGFGSQGHFATVFKRRCGLSPRAYRARARATQ